MPLFDSAATGASILADIERMMTRLPKAPTFSAVLAHPRTAAIMARDATTGLGWQPSPSTVRASSVLGVPLYTQNLLVRRRQVCFPRSKRRRIQKKWRKDPKNWITEPDPHVYLMTSTATVPPTKTLGLRIAEVVTNGRLGLCSMGT